MGVVIFVPCGLCRILVLYTLPRAVWYFPAPRGGDEVSSPPNFWSEALSVSLRTYSSIKFIIKKRRSLFRICCEKITKSVIFIP